MFIERLTDKGDDKIYGFLATKFHVPVSFVKRYVSFESQKPLIRVYVNNHFDNEFKLKEGRLAFTDFNFVHQDKRWDGEVNFDEDWMLYMYQIFGVQYINEFFLYRTIMSHGLFRSSSKKERQIQLDNYNKMTEEAVESIYSKAKLLFEEKNANLFN